MPIEDILKEIKTELSEINSDDFSMEISTTYSVPTQDDSGLTFENFDTKEKKLKSLECCVLFIDIRKSTKISFNQTPEKMSKLYSSFVRGMIRCANEWNGKVRNIIGDRVMVLFDGYDCCSDAVNCAFMMNSVSKILNSSFSGSYIKCGIGIAHGTMFITKCGTIKRGYQNSHYKSLVWAGTTANLASKLTDMANKYSEYKEEPVVRILKDVPKYLQSIVGKDSEWSEVPFKVFFEKLEKTSSPILKYPDLSFRWCYASTDSKVEHASTPAIIITETVYKNFKTENKTHDSIKKSTWNRIYRKIEGSDERYYGTSFKY